MLFKQIKSLLCVLSASGVVIRLDENEIGEAS